MATFNDKVVEEFRRSVTETYELDEEVVSNLCNFVTSAITTVGLPTARGRTRRTHTTRRRKSGYNVFVRTMMSTDDDIKQLSHRDKMAAIGKRWKELGDEERTEFNTLAKEENETESATVDNETEVEETETSA